MENLEHFTSINKISVNRNKRSILSKTFTHLIIIKQSNFHIFCVDFNLFVKVPFKFFFLYDNNIIGE